MFDKTALYVGSRTSHHHHRAEVHEHRAPTDESVRLLREMEQAAEQKLLDSFRLEGCEVDCVVHHLRRYETLGTDHDFIIQYRLGSRRIRVDHRHRERMRDTPEEARQYLAEELLRVVGESIAQQILAPALNKALPVRMFP
jgi:hypothetical protein